MKKINLIHVLLIVIGLILTACGSGGGSGDRSGNSEFTSRTPPPPVNVSQYVAVGSTGTIIHSPGGNIWTVAANPGVATISLNSVAYDGIGRWVAVGSTVTIIHSQDGHAWTDAANSGVVARDLNSVAFRP